jgi:tetratricopeptide (TPR) repeat protein
MGSQLTAVRELLERVLETLTAAVARAGEGTGGVVLIEGPAGVGKSRLLASARAAARDGGVRLLEARGAILEREFACGVARQLFEEAALAVAAAEREALFAGAASLPARPRWRGRARAGAGWRRRVRRRARPVLADRQPRRQGTVCSFPSTTPTGPIRRRFGSSANSRAASRVCPSCDNGCPLAGSRGDRPLARARRRPGGQGPAPPPADRKRRLGARPGQTESGRGRGVLPSLPPRHGWEPLFLRELVVALSEAEVAPTSAAAGTVTEVGPPAVGRFVLRRLERLGPSATALARAVAVLGGEADIRLAARAAGIEAADARSAADLLVRADVLAHDQRLGFVHPIVQAAVYEDLLPGERAARHLAVARLLDETEAPAERVATHLVHSGPTGEPRWVDVLRAAAVSAQQRGAPGTAVAYLRRALDEPPAEEARAEVLCDLGRWEIGAREFEDAQEHLLEALETVGDATVHARAAIWLSRLAITWGRPEPAAAAQDAIEGQLEAATGDLALELEAEALGLTRLELSLRHLAHDRLTSFERSAAGHPRFEPVARIHRANERMARGESAAEVADAVEDALADGPPADLMAFGLAIDTLV